MKLPEYQNIDRITIPDFVHHQISQNVSVHTLYAPYPEIIQLELAFDTGRWIEENKQVAAATATLLKEGNAQFSAYQIAHIIESYGATIRIRGGMDYTMISVYCLRKYAKQLIDFLFDILTSATFPEDELSLYKVRSKEGLRIDLANTEVVSHREFTAMLFGQEHPYGYNKVDEDLDRLDIQQLIRHSRLYRSGLRHIFIGGQCDSTLIKHLSDIVLTYISTAEEHTSISHSIMPSHEHQLNLNICDSLQASLKMGRLIEGGDLRQRQGEYMVNTILGGYFGSRLMTSIRERKGYTYNIYSHIDRFKHHAFLGIHTEVGAEFVTDTITLIKQEIDVLQNDHISNHELGVVKNYLMGSILIQLDGITKSMQTLKQTVLSGGQTGDIYELAEYIKQAQPTDIKTIAQRMLDYNNFYYVEIR